MIEWKEKKIAELPLIIGDGNYSSKYPKITDFIPTGVPFISNKDIKDGRILMESVRYISEEKHSELKKGHLKHNDILISTRANIADVGYVTKEFENANINAQLVFLRTDEITLNAKFLFYLLRSNEYKALFESYASGSAQKQLPISALMEIPIRFPNIEYQKIVAEVFSSLDAKIFLFQRQNKTLEQLAETLFRQWFVEEANAIEPSKLEDWILFDPREKMDKQKIYQMFEMKCLSNTDMSIGEGVFREVSSATTFRNGDTLLAKITPCLENGKTGFVMNLNENEIAKGSTEFIVMRTKGEVSPYWIYCLARNKDFHDSAVLSMTGTSGRQRVQLDLLRNYIVKVDLNTMKQFHESVESYFKKIKSNTNQIRTLTQLRDTLLPKLMSDEIRVKN